MVVKDNFETIGLQSADGSKSLEGFVSDTRRLPGATHQGRRRDRHRQVQHGGVRVQPATNAELAQGHTKNPYALDRVPAGSSGGTAAAVAASFGLVGLGSDTGNSIRGPSAHTALVGIRSTMGLTSRRA